MWKAFSQPNSNKWHSNAASSCTSCVLLNIKTVALCFRLFESRIDVRQVSRPSYCLSSLVSTKLGVCILRLLVLWVCSFVVGLFLLFYIIANLALTISFTVSFHTFKPQIFKLSVSNPKNKYVAYVSVLSQISNCQGLGRKNKHEVLKTDRISVSFLQQPFSVSKMIFLDSPSSHVNSSAGISSGPGALLFLGFFIASLLFHQFPLCSSVVSVLPGYILSHLGLWPNVCVRNSLRMF